MAAEMADNQLVQVVALLGAGVVAVPLFKRLKLGAVLGYFVAGLAIGPFGIGLFSYPQTIMHVAEFGVIMLLFLIGLEMNPARLWLLRRQIFGLGLAQVVVCGLLMTLVGRFAGGLDWPVAFIGGMGIVLSSTAVITQILEERREVNTPQGQKAVSILLLEDLMIVPLLAMVAFLGHAHAGSEDVSPWVKIGLSLAALFGLIGAGRYLLNPLFNLLAAARAREVMTAAALLVVLGSALLMELGGLSMAMGAFLAGVLLSDSSFRHQLEADIEPFRGILLGLFFLSIGMMLNMEVIVQHWRMICVAVVLCVFFKSVGIFVVARAFGETTRDAITRVSYFGQGGEFAFVLYAAALAGGLFTSELNAILTATVILSMAVTPFEVLLMDRIRKPETPSLDGIDEASELEGNILLIGFGRFSQIVSQHLLSAGFNVSIIESNVEMIRSAASFGFKVYYGDGTRLDILHASGAAKAEAILICVGDRQESQKIAELAKAEFPRARLFVAAYDRGHAMDLIRMGVEYQLRETFESAMRFGEETIKHLGIADDEAQAIARDVRQRDEDRLALQVAGDLNSGAFLLKGNAPIPAPLTSPRQEGQIFTAEETDTAS